MGVVLKHTFKNIWSKKIRTLMLLFCIIIASFVGALAFDMTNSVQNILRAGFASMFGDSNVIINYNRGIDEDAFSGLEGYEYDLVKVAARYSDVYKRDEEMYAYYNQKTLTTYGAVSEDLNKLHLLAKDEELSDGECVISKKYSEDFHINAGDKITIYGDNSVPVEFTVKEVLPYFGIIDGGYVAVVNEEGIKSLNHEHKIYYNLAYMKAHDEGQLKEICRILSGNMPNAQIENLVSGEMMTSQIGSISALFYFLFAICVLLVVFVTISLSERIMVERMSTIGTLRSLGVSVKMTTMIVLLENALYGLLGSAIGTTLYTIFRDPMFNGMFSINSGSDIALEMNLGNVSPFVIAGVIIGTILIECLCPIKELLRAVKTPIRDIIFDNKDTDFKYGKKSLVTAVILALIGIPCAILGMGMMAENILVAISGAIMTIAALFLGYPHILRFICTRLAKHFEKKNHPIAKLACVQACTKKASVGNSRLCVMAATICLLLISLVAGYLKMVNWKEAESDVVVYGLTSTSDQYAFFKDLPGVEDVEFVYMNWGSNMVFGSDRIDDYMDTDRSKKNPEFDFDNYMIVGANSKFRMFNCLINMPEKVADNEIYLSDTLAKKKGLSAGDELTILFKPTGVIPEKETFIVKGTFDSSPLNSSNLTIMISEDMYKKIFFDHPQNAYIKCEDPENTVSLINKYSSSMIDRAMTIEDCTKESQQANAGLTTLLYMMIIMGIGLTLIAVFSNQTVGFEGRKRESAVLISTSMSRGKLSKAFILENIAMAAVAIVTGVGIALFLNRGLVNIVRGMSINLPVIYDFALIGAFSVALFLVYVLTVINPLRHLRKMKTAEQLKYE